MDEKKHVEFDSAGYPHKVPEGSGLSNPSPVTVAHDAENVAPHWVCDRCGHEHIGAHVCGFRECGCTHAYIRPEFAPPISLPPVTVEPYAAGEKRDAPAQRTVGDLNDPPIRTTGMPLSELPKCLLCAKHVGSVFRVVDFRMGVVNQRAARQVAGISFGFGFPLKLAEVFSSYDDAVRITSDPRIDERAFLCMECFMGTDLPVLMEKISQRKESNRDDVQDAAAGER